MKAKKIIKLTTVIGITVICGYFGQEILQEMICRRYETASNVQNACINNLRQIEGAKGTAALEMRLKAGDLVSIQTLVPYLEGGWRDCPAGGRLLD